MTITVPCSLTPTDPCTLTKTLVSGDTTWLNKYKMVSAPIGQPPGFNSGAQFYYYYAVAFDYLHGHLGFSPLSTWIAGTYTAAKNSDLGDPGAIALDGTLKLGDRFHSNRSIFLGGDSTIEPLGVATLSGTLSGASVLTVAGKGKLELTGDSINTAPILVNGGTLAVDGSTPAMVLVGDAKLAGSGVVGGLVAGNGSVIAPGHSIGTMSVAGDALFAPGSTYRAEIGAPDKSDRIVVSGGADIVGGTLKLVPGAAPPGFGTYTVLTAEGGVTGTFALAAPDFGAVEAAYPFLAATSATAADAVTVDIGRSDVPFAAVAESRNQAAAGRAADRLAVADPVAVALASVDGKSAPQALDELSGEIHASAETALTEDATQLREALLGRIRQAFDAPGATGVTAPETAPLAASLPFAVWAQAYGSWGDTAATANTAKLDQSIAGALVGVDAALGASWRAGLAGGYSHSSFDLDALASSGQSDNYDVAAYLGGRLADVGPGSIALRLGATYSWHDLSTSRTVTLPRFGETLTADYDAATTQLFGEIGYDVDLGATAFGRARLEPFAGIAYSDLSTDAFTEHGGAAALSGADDDFSSTASTLGLRASTGSTTGWGTLELHSLLAWQHAFGTLTPASALAFAGGTPFTVAGAPLAEDSFLVGVGLEAVVHDSLRLGVSYAGQFGSGTNENAFKGTLAVSF